MCVFQICCSSLSTTYKTNANLDMVGVLGYIDAISEMIDFRKLHGISDAVVRMFSATELYLK